MSFYQSLSSYYDEIFAVSPAEMAFLKKCLAGRRCLLDLGCGTGNKTELLLEAGRMVIGLDSDPEMIAQAGKNHFQAALVEYRLADMSKLGGMFAPGSFDGLLCLGNTLVHLTEEGSLRAFFQEAAKLLEPGGLFIIQILNYDHLRAQGVRKLPLIETARLRFSRYYQAPGPDGDCRPGGPLLSGPNWGSDGLCFRSVLEIKPDESVGRTGMVYENSVPLRPIFKAQLNELLSADFENTEYFGGYGGQGWSADSFVTLSISRRLA